MDLEGDGPGTGVVTAILASFAMHIQMFEIRKQVLFRDTSYTMVPFSARALLLLVTSSMRVTLGSTRPRSSDVTSRAPLGLVVFIPTCENPNVVASNSKRCSFFIVFNF